MIKIYTQIGSGFKEMIYPIKCMSKGSFFKKICCYLLLLLPMAASAQTIVTGTVKDSKGIAVIAATVAEKGAANSTATDMNGKFKITLKGNAGILVVSSVGYKTKEATVGGASELSIVLQEDMNQLNEVVVIGYGSVKKSDLTGSVSSIKGSELNLGGTTSNIGQAIQGKAAGVQVQQTSFAPGGAISVTIRGGNSINSSNEPLYVVDGFISDNGNQINPNDIADIQILKDASATAIYGSRGGNGVVLITTKKGTPGKVSIDADLSNGYQYLSYKPALLTGQQYTDIQNATAVEDGNPPPYPASSFKSANTNWINAATQRATVNNRSVSVSSNDKDSKFYASVNYLDQVGILKNTDMKRYTARVGAEKTLNDNIKIGANFYGATSNEDVQSYTGDITAPLFSLLTAPPNQSVYNADGSYHFYITPSSSALSNALASLVEPTNNVENKLFNGNVYMDYSILKNLTYHISAGSEYNTTTAGQYTPSTLVAGAADGGIASEQNSSTFRWLVENYLTYKFTIKKDHAFTVLLGNSNQKDVDEYLNAGAKGFSTNVFQYYNLGAGSIASQPASYKAQENTTDYYTRVNYAYKDKLLATFTLRDDASSKFGSNFRHGYFPSGAVAYKLTDDDFIKNLNTFSELKVRVGYGVSGNDRIPNNQNFFTYGPYSTVLAPGGPLQVGLEPVLLPNPNLKWESTAQFDAGLDMGFLGGRINATLDIYRKTTSNLLINAPVGQQWGFSTQLINGGSIQNQGIELAINSTNIKTSSFSWNTSFNAAYNKQKDLTLAPGVAEIDANTANPSGTVSGQEFTRLVPGQELGEIYGYVYTGVIKTGEHYAPEPNAKPGDPKYADINGDGAITPADRKYLGNTSPHYTAGFGNDFHYKGFNLNVFFQGAFAYDLYNMNALVLESTTGAAALNRFVPGVNENTNVPREGYFLSPYGSYVNSRFVQNASYVRLKSASISYTVPPSVFQHVRFIQGLSVYAEAQNLFTITGYKGTDPEVNVHPGVTKTTYGTYTGNNLGGGLDFGAFPAFRTLTVGVKLSVH